MIQKVSKSFRSTNIARVRSQYICTGCKKNGDYISSQWGCRLEKKIISLHWGGGWRFKYSWNNIVFLLGALKMITLPNKIRACEKRVIVCKTPWLGSGPCLEETVYTNTYCLPYLNNKMRKFQFPTTNHLVTRAFKRFGKRRFFAESVISSVSSIWKALN